jgi:arylsulfatase A-like enzyme
MLGLSHLGFRLSDYNQHILHTLRLAGYRSTLVGVQHIAGDSSVIGYDEIVPTENGHAESVGPAAADHLGKVGKPFFTSVGFAETHRGYRDPGPDEDDRYVLPPHPIPDTPRNRADMAGFKASARALDRGIGAVLEGLDQEGLTDDTLVICTTDHGVAFPSMKCNLTDGGIGVMLVMRGPHGFTGGKVIDSLVSQIDIFPTLCEMLDLERPSWLEGRSFLPVVRGEIRDVNHEVFAEVTYHAAYEPQRAVRTRRWKYIRRYDDRARPVLTNYDNGPSKGTWLEHGWGARVVAPEQLYDLVFDPNETNNLAPDPNYEGILSNLRSRLGEWMEATHDPLLNGPVPAPPGTIINDPDGISPGDGRRVVP